MQNNTLQDTTPRALRALGLSRKARRKLGLRRLRPGYPKLNPGDAILVERPECGTTRRFLPGVLDFRTGTRAESPTKKLVGRFVLGREDLPRFRSRYAPHIGQKELARR